MDNPWFKLDPNNSSNPWWLYASIVNPSTDQIQKHDLDVICYFIIRENKNNNTFYRVSIWYKNDPNRYLSIYNNSDWKFDKNFDEMNEGDIINAYSGQFRVYNSKFGSEDQKHNYKILERVIR